MFPAEIEGYPVTRITGVKNDVFVNQYRFGIKWYKNTNVKSVVIPEGVEEIGTWAFNLCEALRSVTLPSTIKKIGKQAFSSCSSLKKITLPDTLTEIADNMFSSCYSLTDVNIPASIEKIGYTAFGKCHLTNLKIPESITSIEINNFAFQGSQPPLAVRKRLHDLGYGGKF